MMKNRSFTVPLTGTFSCAPKSRPITRQPVTAPSAIVL
ncbi:hypothetical protein SSPIM334S_06647 [Streptomyces spiroverticillatus]